MCYRAKGWGIILIALGLGFLLSCFLQSVLIKITLGFLCFAMGLLVINRR